MERAIHCKKFDIFPALTRLTTSEILGFNFEQFADSACFLPTFLFLCYCSYVLLSPIMFDNMPVFREIHALFIYQVSEKKLAYLDRTFSQLLTLFGPGIFYRLKVQEGLYGPPKNLRNHSR